MTSMAGGEAQEKSSADSEPAFAFTLKKRSDSVDASVPGNTWIIQEQKSKRLKGKPDCPSIFRVYFSRFCVNICAE